MRTFDEIFAESYRHHNMPVPDIPGTKEGFRRLVMATRHAFPDVKVEIENVIEEGDLVVFNDSVEATSRGDFLGVPPTGRQLRWTEIHMLRVVGAKIVEHWANFDQLGILKQLGAIR
jgi:predicted ester cyclase